MGEVCLQLACKYLEVVYEAPHSQSLLEQLQVLALLNHRLFVTEKTYHVYQKSLASQYSAEIDKLYSTWGGWTPHELESPRSTASSTTSSCDKN